jgi:uncharacterized protein YdaU (DUF1376 family)
MSRRPFMPFYGADFFTDTAHLSRDERDAYLRLIWHYWTHGGLIDDDARLARIAHMSPEEWAAARPIIQAFFHDGWKHRRVDEEIAKASDLIEAARRAGIASGAARRERNERPFDIHSAEASNASRTASANGNEPSTPTPTEERKSSEADASAPNGAQARPVYTDARHELWGEGPAILTALGVPDKSARSNIGRWLRDTRDDAERVLAAIQRARDGGVFEPVAWISRAVQPKGNGHVVREDRSVHAAADRLVERIRAFDADVAGTGGEQSPAVVRLPWLEREFG